MTTTRPMSSVTIQVAIEWWRVLHPRASRTLEQLDAGVARQCEVTAICEPETIAAMQREARAAAVRCNLIDGAPR